MSNKPEYQESAVDEMIALILEHERDKYEHIIRMHRSVLCIRPGNNSTDYVREVVVYNDPGWQGLDITWYTMKNFFRTVYSMRCGREGFLSVDEQRN
jgi:hypothetical protein